MLTKVFMAGALALAVQAAAGTGSPAAASGTAAIAAPTPAAVPSMPSGAEPVIPPLPGLSGTAETLAAPADAGGDSVTAEEVYVDNLGVKTERPDLSKLGSETLASIAGGVDRDQVEVFYDAEQKQPLAEAGPGAWRVDVLELYAELAKRMINDPTDKPARQALSLALYKGDERAKEAKDLAYDDKVALTVIKQLEGGRERSRMELQVLAEKGNRRARLYLGLDKPMVREEADAMSATAQPAGLSPTASTSTAPAPVAVTPSTTASPAPAKASGMAKP
jgi:hypothetical protein